MKKIFAILSAVMITASVFAQAPSKMSYQAVIRNSSNQLVSTQAVGIRISILQGSVTGTIVYTETQTPTTNANGLVTIEIGGGTGFEAINWSNGPYFIKTETDPMGGSNYTITGTSQLLSVPYALHSKTAETLSVGIIEADPVFEASPAKGISLTQITNWNSAFGWGNHAAAGYLKSFTETDPVFGASPVKGISSTQITNWNTAFGWGNHASAGYLKSYTETDPVFGASAANGISSTNVSNWNTAFGWGNHAGLYRLITYVPAWTDITSNPFVFSSVANNQLLKYNSTSGKWENWTHNFLTSFTETDPSWNGENTETGDIGRTGRVGIGINTPGTLLQVHSNTTYSSGITSIIRISDNYKMWNIGLGNSGDRFSIASEDLTERLTILKSNGNVGIGTLSPGAKLEVAGQVKITGGTPGAGKVLTSDASGLATWQAPEPGPWLKNGSSIYYNSGNVAIGMTLPRYNLTIYNDNNPQIGFYNSSSGTSGTDGFMIGTYASGSPVWIWNWENSNMHFGTNNLNRMIIDADGHISMMGYLDLNTDGTFGALYVKGKQALWWDGTYFSWGYDGTYNYFADKVTIGNAANPGYMLYVQGNAYTTGSWSSSDARFKKNITPINNALERIMKIRGTSFEFRQDEFKDYQFADGSQFGFIAQELEDVLPEVVNTDSNGYKSVNYSEVIPVLTEAVKEQQNTILKLEVENERLKKENEQINTRLDNLERLEGTRALK